MHPTPPLSSLFFRFTFEEFVLSVHPMQTVFRRDWFQLILTGFFILVCIAALGRLQMPQLEQLQARSQSASVEQIRQATAAEAMQLSLLKKSPSFGFENLIADWTFLNFLQYFGDASARQKTDYRLGPDYFEVILDRDPYFIPAYIFLSTSGSLYAGTPERSTAIMQKALSSLKPNVPPDSFFAWRQLGVDQLLFLGDSQAAKKSFETAADWARQSSFPGSGQTAASSQQTAAFLANNPNSKTAQVASWAMVLGNAPDDRTQKIATQRIEALGGRIIPNPDGTFRIQPPPKD
jgi:hypothetical protein